MGACTIQTGRSSMMVLKQRLGTAEIRKTPPYTIYQIRMRDCVIIAYKSGKLVFQGNDAEGYAALIAPSVIRKAQNGTTAKKTQEQPKAIYPQADSDEIGTDDYFGPVTACTTCVCHEDVEFLRGLGVQDSKVIGDTTIRHMAPKLMERLPRSLLVLNNATYN